MASAIRKLTGVGGDVRKIARLLQKKAPPGHMLAYINQEEADLLKARGGSGKPHADTGVPSFEDNFYPAEFQPIQTDNNVGALDLTSTQAPSYQTGGEQLNLANQYAQYRSAPFATTAPAAEVPMTDASSGYYRPSFANAPQAAAPAAPVAGTQISEVPMTDFSSGYYRPYYADPQGFTLPEQYASYGAGRQAADSAAALDRIGATPPDKDLLGQVKDWWSTLQPDTKARLGIGGVQAVLGAYQTSQAAEQGRKAKEEIAAMAAPYQQQGKQLIAQAQRGELTPAAQQQLAAVQAQAAQGAQARGGVGAQQAQAQVEAFRQQLLQGQHDYGLKVAGIGDQIMTGAIKTGLQADQYVNQLTNTYYNNIARALYGQAPQVSGQQPASTSAGT